MFCFFMMLKKIEWYEMNGCDVLLPQYQLVPKTIIMFIGKQHIENVYNIQYIYTLIIYLLYNYKLI